MTDEERRQRKRERNRASYAANREKVLAHQRALYAANREKVLERNRARYAANRPKVLGGNRARYAANPKKVLEPQRAYRAANRAKVQEQARASYAANRAKVQARARSSYAANLKKQRERKRAWQKANPEHGRASSQRHRARKASVENNFTAADWQALVERSPRCHWCRQPFTKKRRPTHDHVIPIAAGGPNTPENSACACAKCNSSKGARRLHPVTGQGILV